MAGRTDTAARGTLGASVPAPAARWSWRGPAKSYRASALDSRPGGRKLRAMTRYLLQSSDVVMTHLSVVTCVDTSAQSR